MSIAHDQVLTVYFGTGNSLTKSIAVYDDSDETLVESTTFVEVCTRVPCPDRFKCGEDVFGKLHVI